MKKRARLEDNLQRAVCELLDIYQAQKKLNYFAVPNGGYRSKIEAMIMKDLGTKPGVPDLAILFPNGKTIFMELKSPTGKISWFQHAWIGWLNDNGFPTRVIRTVHEAQDFVNWYMLGQKHDGTGIPAEG